MSSNHLSIRNHSNPTSVRTFQLLKITKTKPKKKKPLNQTFDGKDLLCNERLGSKSPELWPEQVRGVSRFLSSIEPLGSSSSADCDSSNWLCEFGSEEMNRLCSIGNLPPSAILEQVKGFNNLSYQLGVEEAREMSRGNLLDIFNQSRNSASFSAISLFK